MNTYNRNRTRSNEFIRTFINDYNNIIRNHTEMMMEYNRNIHNILIMLQRYSDYTPPPPTPTPTSTAMPTPTRSSNRSDIATLLYRLSQSNLVEESQRGLSQAQINSATENVVYTPSAFPSTPQCPISLDEFDDGEVVCQLRYCRHIFRHRNIMRWFESHTCCPVCRHELDTENINSESTEQAESIDFWSRILNRNIMDLSGNQIYTFEFPIRFNGRSS